VLDRFALVLVENKTSQAGFNAISNTAAAWSRVDRAGAEAWLNSLPDSSAKSRAAERLDGD
jgi:hypothetical protein